MSATSVPLTASASPRCAPRPAINRCAHNTGFRCLYHVDLCLATIFQCVWTPCSVSILLFQDSHLARAGRSSIILEVSACHKAFNDCMCCVPLASSLFEFDIWNRGKGSCDGLGRQRVNPVCHSAFFYVFPSVCISVSCQVVECCCAGICTVRQMPAAPLKWNFWHSFASGLGLLRFVWVVVCIKHVHHSITFTGREAATLPQHHSQVLVVNSDGWVWLAPQSIAQETHLVVPHSVTTCHGCMFVGIAWPEEKAIQSCKASTVFWGSFSPDLAAFVNSVSLSEIKVRARRDSSSAGHLFVEVNLLVAVANESAREDAVALGTWFKGIHSRWAQNLNHQQRDLACWTLDMQLDQHNCFVTLLVPANLQTPARPCSVLHVFQILSVGWCWSDHHQVRCLNYRLDKFHIRYILGTCISN